MDMSSLYGLASCLPFECMQASFMQRALLGLLLLAPMTAVMGVQVVNLRMAFYSDAISHSAFAGVALGLIFSIDPHLAMPALGVLVGLGIMALLRHSSLSSDTVIGVMFAAVMAFGLAVVSRSASIARNLQQFLYGDILMITDGELAGLLVLFLVLSVFQWYACNRLIYMGVHPMLARVHGVPVRVLQYCFAGLLAVVVMFSVWAVGVLLVTAMLIVPAAAARNFARSTCAMFWWALCISVTSALSGLLLSAQEWMQTATGATIILISCAWFLVSALVAHARGDRLR
ncbi:MAG: metal ABC transporter permease [Desulfovibrionaceae bacterium]|nr:metal ABC transporter permease [Desulfovibrionaceae bacterium]